MRPRDFLYGTRAMRGVGRRWRSFCALGQSHARMLWKLGEPQGLQVRQVPSVDAGFVLYPGWFQKATLGESKTRRAEVWVKKLAECQSHGTGVLSS